MEKPLKTMHKVLQFTLVFILSTLLLTNTGLNQTTTVNNEVSDKQSQAEQLKSFITSQNEETQSRIMSLQILAKESLAMLGNYEVEQDGVLLMKSELNNLLAAIDHLPSSPSLSYELSYLEDNLKMIQTELNHQGGQQQINIAELNCQEISTSLMSENSIVLFSDSKNGGIRSTGKITRSAGESIFHLNVRMKNKQARDIIGGLEKNTLLIFEAVDGTSIKCTNKERTYGKWNESSSSHDYLAQFGVPENCQYSSKIDKIKLIWSNGLHVYTIDGQKAINEFFACKCRKS